MSDNVIKFKGPLILSRHSDTWPPERTKPSYSKHKAGIPGLLCKWYKKQVLTNATEPSDSKAEFSDGYPGRVFIRL